MVFDEEVLASLKQFIEDIAGNPSKSRTWTLVAEDGTPFSRLCYETNIRHEDNLREFERL